MRTRDPRRLLERERVYPTNIPRHRYAFIGHHQRIMSPQELSQANQGNAERTLAGIALFLGPKRIDQLPAPHLLAAVRDERFQQLQGLARRLAGELDGLIVEHELEASERADPDGPGPCGWCGNGDD